MEELLVKFFSGEATQDERNQVREWRSATENNAKTFFDYKKVWLQTEPEVEPNRAILNQILDETTVEEEEQIKIIPLWEQKLFKIAAAIVLILGAVFTVFQMNKAERVYGEPVAEVTVYTLPDGSTATLQKGASITIGDFKTVREVTLQGKAFFEVVRNEQKPFTVSTEEVLVKVLGTSFVVNAPKESDVEVLVNSGIVAFGHNPAKYGTQSMSINLEKGEMGVLRRSEKGIKKLKIEDENFLSWKTKILSFRKQSLAEVSKTMEDVYGITLEFENPAVRNCSLTARFKEKSADEVVDIIAKTFNLTYEKKGDTVKFSGQGCGEE